MKKVERLERNLVVKGVLFDYYQDTVIAADGKVAKWDFIGHKGAAAVVPVLEDGRILMVRQYRNALDRETLEIPAGGLNTADEPTKDAAARELSEETGYTSDDLFWLITVRTTVAFCNEKIDIYVAKNLKKGQQHLDEDEDIDVETYTIEELMDMVFTGKIEDSKTISALAAYQCQLNQNK